MTPRQTLLELDNGLNVPLSELEFEAMRAQGPGGQNVNKVSSAVQLRFDVNNASLPDYVKTALLARQDRRLTRDGVLVIKAQRQRSQEKNRAEAIQRLVEILNQASVRTPARVATRPTRASRRRRLDAKARRGQLKSRRGRVAPE